MRMSWVQILSGAPKQQKINIINIMNIDDDNQLEDDEFEDEDDYFEDEIEEIKYIWGVDFSDPDLDSDDIPGCRG